MVFFCLLEMPISSLMRCSTTSPGHRAMTWIRVRATVFSVLWSASQHVQRVRHMHHAEDGKRVSRTRANTCRRKKKVDTLEEGLLCVCDMGLYGTCAAACCVKTVPMVGKRRLHLPIRHSVWLLANWQN